ncbi:hypothetical protein CRM22_010331 [Opisthorchis felineus]|uniref:Uncharacterized protein n=1 Tax=Opisthorchis felineus TaxID=147828 RepID=A0A4S2KZC1_OPIFE|nr:hypothetical protein CRM22_010331 [Opisthorchis felineus]
MYGPEFINEPKIPVSPLAHDRIPDGVELKTIRATGNVLSTRSVTERLFVRWSSWFTLLKAIAWLMRFIYYLMHKFKRSITVPTVGHQQVKELTVAQMVVVRQIQAKVYGDEISHLKTDTHSMPTRVLAMRKLCPILLDGVLCVGGWLQYSSCALSLKQRLFCPLNPQLLIYSFDIIMKQKDIPASHVLGAIRKTFV